MTLVDHSNAPQGGGPSQQNGNGGGTELDKLWALLGELSNQLSHNRQQTEELHRRAEELKTQAVHTQTGFTLRRFNVDVSKEEFESELERLNVSLVTENQGLQHENRQLSVLLKDYEGTLEAVMGKFRAHAHATSQHHLDLVRHYEGILLSLPQAAASPSDPLDSPSAPTIDPLHLQLSLAHLGALIRKALRSLQGEDPEDVEASPMLFPFGGGAGASENAGDGESLMELASALGGAAGAGADRERESRDVSTGGYIGRSASTNPHYIPTTSTSSLVSSPPRPGNAPLPKEGAAPSMEKAHDAELRGPVDDALEREIEIEALRRENEELRRLLGISEELEAQSAGMAGTAETRKPIDGP